MALVWACCLVVAVEVLSRALAWQGMSGRRKRLVGWGAGVLCAAGVLYVAADAWGDRPLPFTPTPAVRAVVAGNTALAIDLYQKLGATNGNVFFSPYSISTALALVYGGARGGTEKEMGRAAHFNLSQAELHPAFGELVARMNRVQHGERLMLFTANALWHQQGHSFSNSFLGLARTRYRADVEAADFKGGVGAVTERINAWVARRTRGKINTMGNAARLDSNTRLVLCNALYFKGAWRSQFNAKDTQPAEFYVSTNRTVTVPRMTQSAEFRMASVEEPPATLLDLPYYGGDLAMVIILPEERDGLPELEQALTVEHLEAWLARLDRANPHKTWVCLPRFTTRQSVDLVPALRSLGMVSAFDDTADFSGMDGTKKLYLSDVLHQTFVEVNEKGTEAATVTLSLVMTMGMDDRFRADHPFLFLIRDRGSGTILFLGRMVDPSL